MRRLLVFGLLCLLLAGGAVSRAADDGPVITAFDSGMKALPSQQLKDGTLRVPVTWAVINRPLTATLVFEQVMSDDEVLNVELPRDFFWVNSADKGIVVPNYPGDGIGEVELQLRVISVFTMETLAKRTLTLPVYDATPQIVSFTTSTESIPYADLVAGKVQVPVEWRVVNRPANANLRFFQVHTDGLETIAELPRDWEYVASEGVGISPLGYTPGNSTEEVVLRLSLYDTRTGNQYDSEHFTIPVTDEDEFGLETFDVQPRSVQAGDPITVTWDVRGVDSVSVHISYEGLRFGSRPLDVSQPTMPASGSMTIDAPTTVRTAQVFIMAPAVLSDQGIRINIMCAIPWFDGDENLCPDDVPKTAQAAYQTFENGFTIWRGGEIMVMYDGGTGGYYNDNWNGQMLEFAEQPPAGLEQPINGFGYLWINNVDMRERLGWATAPEQGYQMTYQSTAFTSGVWSGTRFVMTLPDGELITVSRGMGTLNWRE